MTELGIELATDRSAARCATDCAMKPGCRITRANSLDPDLTPQKVLDISTASKLELFNSNLRLLLCPSGQVWEDVDLYYSLG